MNYSASARMFPKVEESNASSWVWIGIPGESSPDLVPLTPLMGSLKDTMRVLLRRVLYAF